MGVLRSFRPDPLTATMTVVIVPLMYLFLRKVAARTGRMLSYALDWLLWIISHSFIHSLSGIITLRRYCRSQLKGTATKYLQVPGAASDTSLETDKIYVPLTLEFGGRQAGSYSHHNLYDVGNRLQILGDPGSGKSSLMKKLFRDACHKAIAKPRRARLPIPVALSEFIPPLDQHTGAELADWSLSRLREIVVAT